MKIWYRGRSWGNVVDALRWSVGDVDDDSIQESFAEERDSQAPRIASVVFLHGLPGIVVS